MTHADDLMANPPAMAEMAGGLLDAEGDAVLASAAGGHDASLAVAAELAAEDTWTPSDAHPASEPVAPGLAALEAETEE
jgi:hypothetical protein